MCSEKDEYFIKALKEGYRARSAFKLLQIAECFDLFKDTKNVIDLCAAPGSWSQVISNQLHNLRNITEPDKVQLTPDVKIVAIDLAPIRPIAGVTSLVADITDIKTCEKLMELFEKEKVDLIVCDGAHDVSGMVSADFQLHLGLITACIHILLQTLKNNGSFVAKIFDTWGCQIFISQLRIFFKEVHVVKPHSSRSESYECFAVCKKYNKPTDFDPSQLTPYLNYDYREFSNLTGIHKYYVPFLVLGHYDIKPEEFEELYKKYGDELYRHIIQDDITEELFTQDELSEFKVSLEQNERNIPDHEKFVNKLLSKGKFAFGTSKKPFILYLNKDNKIDFRKTLDRKFLPMEINENESKEDKTDLFLSANDSECVNDSNFITKLFNDLSLGESNKVPSDPEGETHPWFSERILDEDDQEVEDFDLESLLDRTEDEVMKIIRENNGTLPEHPDLSEKFLLLENSNDVVLELVKERRDIVEKIQEIIDVNKL